MLDEVKSYFKMKPPPQPGSARKSRRTRQPPARAGQLPPLPPGTQVDHFQVVRCLGRGGMGVVYLARDTSLGRKIALKLVDPALARSPDAVSMFLREARATARFNHPHIVTIHAVGQHISAPYIALEYLEGQTLRERLDGGHLGLKESIRTALAIAEALREAHAHGIVHGDLKPDNVVIPTDGRLRVVDFGICRVIDPRATAAAEEHERSEEFDGDLDDHRHRNPWGTTVVWVEPIDRGEKKARADIGTPAYMAPEQWRSESVTGAADVWALGLILGEVAALWHPYSQLMTESGNGIKKLARAVVSPEAVPTPSTLGDGVSTEVTRIIATCLRKDPAKRPTASELVEQLQDMLGQDTPDVISDGPFPGLQPFDRNQSRFFFGRETEIAAFVERMRLEPILPVIGPAGVGKSSFVRAGVIPRLEEQGEWLVIDLTPGGDPFAALAGRVLAHEDAEDWDTENQGLWQQLMASPPLLSLKLRTLARRKECRVLLLVDQLEEIVTQVTDPFARRAFLESICSAADDPDDPVRVIFTLRDDYIGRLAQSERAREVLSRVTVLASHDAAALEKIVTRPLDKLGYDYDDPQLPLDMVTAVLGEPACLPLLQFATRMLWERRERRSRTLQRSVYDAFGGVEGALAAHADEVLKGISPGQRRITRSLLLRLVAPEGTQQSVGRDELLEGLGDEGEKILVLLIRARLVSTRQEDDRGVVQISLIHRSLIHSWSRLSDWITEGQEDLRFLKDVSRAANLWLGRGARPDEVWRRDALEDARRSIERCSLPVPPQVMEFLEAGDQQQKRKRWRRRGIAVLLVGLAGLAAAGIGLAVMAVIQRGEQARLERDRALISWAEAQREGARAALARGDLLEARAKLRGSIETSDSVASRVLWHRLRRHPLKWTRSVGSIIYDVSVSPDGRTVAAAAQDHAIHLADARTGQTRVLRGHKDQVFSLAYAGRGHRLASATLGGEVRVWDRKGRTVASHPRLGASIQALATSRDGKMVAFGSADGAVKLWRPDRAGASITIGTHADVVRTVAFSPDDRFVASGGLDGRVKLWNVDARTGGPAGRGKLKPHRTLHGKGPGVLSVAFSPDGARLAAVDTPGVITIWDIRSRQRKQRIVGIGRPVQRIRFSPDGKQIAVATLGNGVRLLDAATGRLRRVLPGVDGAISVAFGPRGVLLASGGMDRTLRLWDTSTPGDDATRSRRQGFNTVAFAPDGKLLASGSVDHSVRLWNVSTGEVERELTGHRDLVYRVVFSPDGQQLASASWDGTVRVWDRKTGFQSRILDGHGAAVLDLAFSPDGRLLASGGRDGSVKVWRVASGRVIRRLRKSKGPVIGVAFGSGLRLATTSYDGKLRLYAVDTGELETELAYGGRPYGVAFTPDGQLVTSGWDGAVRLWNPDWPSYRIIGTHRGRAYRIAAGADGTIGSVGADGRAVIWKATPGGGVRVEFSGHHSEVNDLTLSSDGTLAATAADDGTVRLWRTRDGQPVWQVSAILGSTPRLLSHQGWHRPGRGPLDPAASGCGAGCRRLLESGARKALAAPGSGVACITSGDQIVLWDLRRDRRIAREAVKGLDQVTPLLGGCASLARGEVRIHRGSSPTRVVARKARALYWDGKHLSVAEARRVRTLDLQGKPAAPPLSAAAGITAIGRGDGQLLLGLEGGQVKVRDLTRHASLVLQETPSSRVMSLRPVGSSLAAVGFANGLIGLWSLKDGALLERAWLHGPIIHIAQEKMKLNAVSELGQHVTWDLSSVRQEYCRVMREVWSHVPVLWTKGRAVARIPPRAHRCSPDAAL